MRFRMVPVVMLAGLLAVLFAACSTSSTSEQASDASHDWSRLEAPMSFRYQMEDSVQVYGEMTQQVERTQMDGREIFEVTYLVDNGNLASENKLRFDASTGEPIGLVATQRMRGMEASTEVTYDADKVTRIMTNPGMPQPDTAVTEIPPNTRDWMQVGFLLQATDMAQMDTLRMPFYQGFGRAFVDTATLINTGVESVEVPAGTFDAHRVHILYAGAEADFFIEASDHPRVIKHEIPGRQGPLATVLLPDEPAMAEGETEEEG